MVKKIFLVISLLIMTYIASFIVMYNETLKSVESIISSAIITDDYHTILSYNDYYIDTPQYSNVTNNLSVSVYNTYDENTQTLTLIIIDRLKVQGDQSELRVTCTNEQIFTDIFTEYDDGSIAVLTLYKDGEDEFSLKGDCLNEKIENLLVKLNDGQVVLDIDDIVGFINDEDIIQSGTKGFTIEEVEQMQYPNGLIKPLIIPILSLWIIVFGLLYVNKRFLRKKI